MRKQNLFLFFLFVNITMLYSITKEERKVMKEYLQNQNMKWEQLP